MKVTKFWPLRGLRLKASAQGKKRRKNGKPNQQEVTRFVSVDFPEQESSSLERVQTFTKESTLRRENDSIQEKNETLVTRQLPISSSKFVANRKSQICRVNTTHTNLYFIRSSNGSYLARLDML